MKKGLYIILLILTLSGCTKINNDNMNVIADSITNKKVRVNSVSNSYKYYLPVGVSTLTDYEFNQKFKYNNNELYLYVDVVSYYYKNKLNYENDIKYDYYYKKLVKKDKSGFIGISKSNNDKYFVNIVYNYAKIEFYANKEDLDSLTVISLIVINSIDYNDLVIKDLIDTGSSGSKDILYEIDKPEDAKSNFSKYLEEYVSEEDEYEKLPDE